MTFSRSFTSATALLSVVSGLAIKRDDGSAVIPLTKDQNLWFTNFDVGNAKNVSLLVSSNTGDIVLNKNVGSFAHGSFVESTLPDAENGCAAQKAVGNLAVTTVSTHGLTLDSQTISAISNSTQNSQPSYPHQGIVGLAGSDASEIGGTSFFERLFQAGTLKAHRFALALTGTTGNLVLGTVDTTKFSGNLLNSASNDKWVTKGNVVVAGAQLLDQFFTISSTVPGVIGPVAQVKEIFKMAGITASTSTNSGCKSVVTGTYPCAKPPVIGISFPFPTGDNTAFAITPSALAASQKGSICTASIIGIDETGSHNWTLGQAWLQGKYVDFSFAQDFVGPSINIANLR